MRFLPTISIALTGTLVVTGLLIPEPPGPYKILLQTKELIDQGRPDPWNISHPRRLMVSRFDPIPPSQCHQMCKVPYMSPFLASAEDAILESLLSSAGLTWPRGVLDQLELQVCCSSLCSSNSSFKSGPYPVVLFGPGLNTTRLLYSALAQQIASSGYTVITMDHPYETDVVEFPDGTVIYGGRVAEDTNDTGALVHALDVRTNDASFVLRELGIVFITETDDPSTAQAGMVGHGFGGAAVGAAILNDTRIVAGVNLDGVMLGPVLNAGIGRPGIHQSFLLWGAEGHNSSSDESWARFLETVKMWDEGEWVGELALKGAVHGSFADFGVVADVAGLRADEGLAKALFGKISGARVMQVVATYVDAFMNKTLRGGPDGLLSGPSEVYPEVEFL